MHTYIHTLVHTLLLQAVKLTLHKGVTRVCAAPAERPVAKDGARRTILAVQLAVAVEARPAVRVALPSVGVSAH